MFREKKKAKFFEVVFSPPIFEYETFGKVVGKSKI